MVEKACGSYEIVREGEDTIVNINCEACSFFPSIEDNARTMAIVIDILTQVTSATKIILTQKREYEYDVNQTQILLDLAKIYKQLIRHKLAYGLLSEDACRRYVDARYGELHDVIFNLLKSDPVASYVELLKISERENNLIKTKAIPEEGAYCLQKYYRLLEDVVGIIQNSKIITLLKPYLADYQYGDREIYKNTFAPMIKPDFMFTKLMASYPRAGEEIDNYSVNETEVTVFQLPENVQYLYHIVPPEFKLTEEKYEILDAARKLMAEYKPKKGEFVDPERVRQVFYTIGGDLLDELSAYRGIRLRQKEKEELNDILVRYTVGFGLIEVLLADENIQDVTINSPTGVTPAFIVHSQYGNCMTNVIPTFKEAESWASKLRIISGRPLDEANPILDTEIILPNARARVAAITSPLNPTGIAYALRRHRDRPWTLPLFIKKKMLNPLAAGIISFLIDGNRTLLVAGTRSAGKTSLLGSLMIEIMRKGRVVTIEDTLELPVSALRKLNYNIQSMKVASALTRGTNEVSADEGIRSTLRLGDSSLIIGEIRSIEAKALYEAMRIGALANVVAGTIHGDSPYGVFDRVVNDLEVPRTSFKATDIIIVANPIKSPDGLHRWRRVTQITEVRKHWENDPSLENGFVDLMKYNANTDQLEPTDELINGDSEVLKSIAGNVKEWSGSWDAVWDNILLRSKMKERIVEISKKSKMPNLLEADFVVMANDEFHKISDNIRQETGILDSKKIFFEWDEWLKRSIKKMNMKQE